MDVLLFVCAVFVGYAFNSLFFAGLYASNDDLFDNKGFMATIFILCLVPFGLLIAVCAVLLTAILLFPFVTILRRE